MYSGCVKRVSSLGAIRTGLAEAWRSRVAGQAAESEARLAAESYLALSLLPQGKCAAAEQLLLRAA